jgi:hypothetical protein
VTQALGVAQLRESVINRCCFSVVTGAIQLTLQSIFSRASHTVSQAHHSKLNVEREWAISSICACCDGLTEVHMNACESVSLYERVCLIHDCDCVLLVVCVCVCVCVVCRRSTCITCMSMLRCAYHPKR